MTQEERLIVNYLQAFPGQEIKLFKMLGLLADIQVGYVRNKLPVKREVRRAARRVFLAAASRLMKARTVIRHRTPQVYKGRRVVRVRLHASFETKSVL